MLWRTGILKHRRILVYTVVAAMANVMWSWLRACSIVSEQTLWLCALLGLFVYFCALFCELLAAHTELRFTAVCVALFSGFVYPFLIGALVRLRGMDGGKFYILVAFLLSMVADSGAYFVGRACGKHKLAPIVSPKKTVEGAVGGVVCNIVFLCLYTLLLNKCFGFTQVNLCRDLRRAWRSGVHRGRSDAVRREAAGRHQGLRQSDPRPRRHPRPL